MVAAPRRAACLSSTLAAAAWGAAPPEDADADWHLMFTSGPTDDFDERPLTVTEGELPQWLHGDFFQGSPSVYEMGGYKMDSFFDGFFRLSRLSFTGGEARFTSRMMGTHWWNASVAAGKIAPGGMMMGSTPPLPCQRLGLPGCRASGRKNSDNNYVKMHRVGDTYYAMTDAEPRVQFDPQSLSYISHITKFDGDAVPAGYIAEVGSAHGMTDEATGDYIGIFAASSPVAKKPPAIVVYRMPAGQPTLRKHIATVECPGTSPRYMHSFGVTAHYAVLILEPFIVGMNMSHMKDMTDMMHVDYSVPTEIAVVRLDGTGEVMRFRTPDMPSFSFVHVANTYEEDSGDVVIDIAEIQNATSNNDTAGYFGMTRFDLLLNKTAREALTGQWYPPIRFTLPVSKYADGARDATTRLLVPDSPAVGLPTVSPRHQNKPYCYMYVMEYAAPPGDVYARMDVGKIDVCKGTYLRAPMPTAHYASEVTFVPRPDGTEEDDGVAIATLLDGPKRTSYMQVYDAATMTPIARLDLPLRIPFPLHGSFFP